MIGETLKLIVDLSPRLAMVGGPPVYLSGFSVNESNVKRGLDHLATIVEKIPTTIIDHHLLRTENWREHALAVFEAAERACHKVMTAAEYLGRQNDLLECRRDKLYKAEPPSEEFVKWTKLPILKQRRTKPPI
jgi:predicted metallo-beta-lactamase superfamily hydrolase